MADLYLKAIQRELAVSIGEYLAGEFKTHLAGKNVVDAKRKVQNTADEVIKNTRTGVQSFRIKGGQSFAAFLDQANPLASGTILQAKEDVFQAIKTAIERQNTSNLAATIRAIVEDAGRKSEKLIKTELEKRYR